METPTLTPTIETVETIATTPMTVEDYLSLAEDLSADGGVKIEGVQYDYRALAAVFPLALPDGYATPIRRHTIEDPENGYITDVVEFARRGIFGRMILQNVNPFLEIEQYEAVAAQAGDVF